MIKRIMLLITLLMTAVFVSVLVFGRQLDHKANQSLAQFHEAVQEYEKEQSELRNQIAQLNRQNKSAGTVEYLFLEPTSQLYTDVFPVMQEYGFVGVIQFSEDRFPGDPGCMTWDQYHALRDHGWTFCLECPDSAKIYEWYDIVSNRLSANGLDQPDSVFFTNCDYDASLDPDLHSLGFTVAIHQGETNLPCLTTEIAEDVWHPGAYFWDYYGVEADIDSVATSGANLVYISDFSGDYAVPYEAERFRQVLDVVNTYVEEGTLYVTDFASALEIHGTTEYSKRSNAVQKDIDKLQNRIDELQSRIDELYEQWRQ